MILGAVFCLAATQPSKRGKRGPFPTRQAREAGIRIVKTWGLEVSTWGFSFSSRRVLGHLCSV